MAFHKHGMFSFQVTVERIGGGSFSATLTALPATTFTRTLHGT